MDTSSSTPVYEWMGYKWKNPQYCAPVEGEYCARIDLELKPPGSSKWFPFTLCREDTGAAFDCQSLHDQVVARGGIVPYTPPTQEEVLERKRMMMTMERHKFKYALYNIGKLDAAKAAMADAPMETQFEWEDAPSIHRQSPVVLFLQQQLGMSDDAVDAMFPDPVTPPM